MRAPFRVMSRGSWVVGWPRSAAQDPRPTTAAARAMLLAAIVVGVAACEREHRDFHTTPPGAGPSEASVRTSALHAGPAATEQTGGPYQDNRWAISEGKRLYEWMNCAGCHAPGGGGGIGPSLIDDDWIYGADPENVFDTIVKGRPQGMPSYRGRLGNSEVWKLVAYVRTLGGFTPSDAWPARGESMSHAMNDQKGSASDTSRIPPESRAPPARGAP
jgi:cytochrome c oxidase cbb3-type subunit III